MHICQRSFYFLCWISHVTSSVAKKVEYYITDKTSLDFCIDLLQMLENWHTIVQSYVPLEVCSHFGIKFLPFFSGSNIPSASKGSEYSQQKGKERAWRIHIVSWNNLIKEWYRSLLLSRYNLTQNGRLDFEVSQCARIFWRRSTVC